MGKRDDISTILSTDTNQQRNVARDKQTPFIYAPAGFMPAAQSFRTFSATTNKLRPADGGRRKLGGKARRDKFAHRLVYRVIEGLSAANTRDWLIFIISIDMRVYASAAAILMAIGVYPRAQKLSCLLSSKHYTSKFRSLRLPPGVKFQFMRYNARKHQSDSRFNDDVYARNIYMTTINCPGWKVRATRAFNEWT